MISPRQNWYTKARLYLVVPRLQTTSIQNEASCRLAASDASPSRVPPLCTFFDFAEDLSEWMPAPTLRKLGMSSVNALQNILSLVTQSRDLTYPEALLRNELHELRSDDVYQMLKTSSWSSSGAAPESFSRFCCTATVFPWTSLLSLHCRHLRPGS